MTFSVSICVNISLYDFLSNWTLVSLRSNTKQPICNAFLHLYGHLLSEVVGLRKNSFISVLVNFSLFIHSTDPQVPASCSHVARLWGHSVLLLLRNLWTGKWEETVWGREHMWRWSYSSVYWDGWRRAITGMHPREGLVRSGKPEQVSLKKPNRDLKK